MNKSLFLGLSLGGLAAGYMVGGSSSPVVGAVLPALFTTVAAGVALLFDNPLDRHVAQILASPESRDDATLKALREWNSRRKRISGELGPMLVAFFLAYLV